MAEDTTTAAAATPPTGVSSRARARAALALVGRTRERENPVLEPLFQVVRTTHPKADLTLIERAYAVAERAHEGQKRRSGDDYITHPLAVTTILAELGMTPTTLAAALLHDTVEDTAYSLEALRSDFGDEIAMLVDGVTKLDKVTYGQAAQAETVRKMVVAMARDIRVLVIKLADRLHNARTWRYVSQESAQRKAKETLEIYAPLAHRLGMNTIKWELEDLSFQALYPKVYDEIVRLVAERAPAREEYLATVRDEVGADLRSAKIKATVTGRPKHYYSVYQKMIVGGRDFEQIYDLVAVRVLVETVRDCYAALGALHARWNPVPGRFKDYIAMPKFNMYQSLHTTVIGPGGKPVEIQIRTHTMHRRAEYGVAAHWKYKEDPGAKGSGNQGGVQVRDGQADAVNDMAWLRQLLDWQKETSDPGEFLESLRFEINASEVYVFTPKGQLVGLPAGSTPVDFAYAVHTEVGHHCIGARVNGRLVPLESRLDNGDVVEVLTSKADSAGPSRDWLSFVRSARARNKIRHWFTKERREEMIDEGKESLAKVMRKQGLPLQRLTSVESLTGIARGAAPRRHRRPLRRDRRGHRVGTARRVAPRGVGRWRGRRQRGHRGGGPSGRPSARATAGRGTPASSSRTCPTCGSSWPAAAPRCPATTSSGSSRGATVCPCTAGTAPTPTPCSRSPRRSSRSSGRRRRAASSSCSCRSRRWTARGCSPTSPGSSRTTGSTSSRPR